ncbi:hypothetical protein ACFYNM_08900 [Streptomyces spororaveus]|uniref:hypothetical protein n=1 Tax=Streptomyces spororaveus TaxID=284039 RepID=UPI0036CC80D9
MFIRPMGVTVRPADRPAGHPLLRGLLARASGAAEPTTADAAGAVSPAAPAAPPPPGAVYPAEPPSGASQEPPDLPEPAEPEPAAAAAEALAPDHTAAAGAAGVAAPAGLVAELTQLAGLAREGLLTPQEFTTAKARLLRG